MIRKHSECNFITSIGPCSNPRTSLGSINPHSRYYPLWNVESITILSLKGASYGGRRKGYLNRLRPQLLSDVQLLGAIGT